MSAAQCAATPTTSTRVRASTRKNARGAQTSGTAPVPTAFVSNLPYDVAAPLILPGLQVAKVSNRTVVGPALFPKGLPPKELFHLIFQGFDGLPVLGSQ